MKSAYKVMALLIGLLVGVAIGAGAQDMATAQERPVRVVGAAFEPSEVLVGDHLYLHIDVEAEDGYEVAFPTITEDFTEGRIELLEEITTDTVSHKEGVWALRKSYRLTSFEPAEYHLDSLGVLYSDGLTIDTAFVGGGALRLKVDIMPVDTAQKTIYDIRQPMKAPLVVEEFGGYVALGVLALAVVASVVYLIVTRKRRTKGAEQEEELPKEAPHIVAIRHLEALSHQKLWQNGKHKVYWSRLTEILREYLEGRYGVGAMEMTSEEIVAELKKLELEPKQVSDLRSLLAESDLVKFAKHTPDAESNEEAYNKVYYFVENTKEQAAEGVPTQEPQIEAPQVVVPIVATEDNSNGSAEEGSQGDE